MFSTYYTTLLSMQSNACFSYSIKAHNKLEVFVYLKIILNTEKRTYCMT